MNEIEGLIKQKCPEVDLRIENVLTNELFSQSSGNQNFLLTLTETLDI